ncbi:ammonium transporter [Saccharomonospora xinjiangensis]|uniref:ammonium transporter n=1 Tax=Saccharomonospora xinjiangensis TaxID=75294 RepID=UPI0010705DCD|nr:ammonium transporter [Saccharomonospora xinjiangensis]QBQ59427.1 Ammonia channel precursor [Saccharomonospora xinjiangensis]
MTVEGNTAWLLTSAALVLLMTPGLAFFYGGMVRAKSVLNMLMMCFGAMGLVGVLWMVYGYSTAYGTDIAGLVGNPLDHLGLSGLMTSEGDPTAGTVDVAFQAMFAIITTALIAGAVADRMRFGSWLLFAGLWATLGYFPVAHWVWGDGGWIGELGALDFAGGTAVHINAGAAAFGLVLVLGKRVGWPSEPMKPHNLPFVMLGAGLLWFGWFGFNAGSAYAADGVAGVAFVNTVTATCAAMLAWLLAERLRDGKATSLGAASGVVAGLVAITPACAYVDTWGALGIGGVAGVLCALAVGLKYRFGFDDSLDVVGVHLVGGLAGTVLLGFMATTSVAAGDGRDGLFYGGGAGLLGAQVVSAVAVMAYSAVVAMVLGLAVRAITGGRVGTDAEISGIDEAEHAEAAYDFTGARGDRTAPAATAGPAPGGTDAVRVRTFEESAS